MALGVAAGLAVLVIVVLVLVRDDRSDVAVIDAIDPVAPTSTPGGRLVWAERTTGVIRVLAADRPNGTPGVFAEIPDDLRTDGQRGLLGLAVREESGASVAYASWTRARDGRLVVGRVPEGASAREVRLVWEGPVTTTLANGGTLAFRGDRLLIGVGELQDWAAVADPSTPNGKVLALDPAGPADQTPEVVSSGWHNPFALTVIGDDVWLLDNAPGEQPERIARIPEGASPVIEDLGGRRAPSAVVGEDGSLLVCGYVSGVVERFSRPPTGVPTVAIEDTGWPCATGIAVVGDRVVTTTADAVHVRER